ncbi:MAG: hypothetical protein HYY48_04040 [Gammaproteobacteria bacterium]|nr:hypothetical protein [Gammaproteobacteria bacterium]
MATDRTDTAVSASPATGRGFRQSSSLELLSLCPLLAASTSLLSALTMSSAFIFVLCASAISASCCRRLIAPEAELACLLILAAAWVSIADLVLQAGLYPMRATLGIYVPVMACNCLLLVHLEENALTSGPRAALSAALGTGMRVAAWVVAVGLLRELTSMGGLLSDAALLEWLSRLEFVPFTLPVLASAPGVFIALSILVAAATRLWPAWTD